MYIQYLSEIVSSLYSLIMYMYMDHVNTFILLCSSTCASFVPPSLLHQVILSKDQKELILNTVSNFEGYKRCRRKMGLDDAITYGAGMVMLFHGAPGTGKTMMANALANKLQKKVPHLHVPLPPLPLFLLSPLLILI